MNLIRPLQLALVVAAAAALASVANAGSRCTDDPERCVERGASASRPASRNVVSATLTAMPVVSAPAPARKPLAMRKVTIAPKAVRVTPAAPATPAPTPGMGLLLKLSSGTGGDVSWQPGARAADNTGASWIL